MATAAKPIPEGYHTITPYLIVRDAGEAIAFYQEAFGAIERFRLNGPDGKSVMHGKSAIRSSSWAVSRLPRNANRPPP
jgi:PhnB protein